MSTALVETLLQLHRIDPDAIGLGDFGHPDGFLARQVRRWWQQWEASKTRDLPSIEALRSRLEETVPAPSAPGIVHGDYRLDNVMYAPADPSRIVAVIDWEMCTIGDPLCDVGLLCVYWADDESEAAARTLHGRAITVEDGFYKRADLLRDYAAGTERDLTSLDWYIALGAYKLAIIAEGITARFLMGMTVGEGFETMGEMVPAIVDSGLSCTRPVGIRARRLTMDFTETPRVRELSERVWRFMDERIRPAEEEYWRGFSAETIPQRISPVMEELKAEARRRGLWNLFLPDKRFGAGLTNLEYGALAEIMGWSASRRRR